MAAEAGHPRARRGRLGALGPLSKLGLAVQVLAAHRRARRAMRHGSLPIVLAALRRPQDGRAASAPGDPLLEAQRLGRATFRTLAVLPLDSRCLMQSLTLTSLLAQRGIPSELVIGVRPGVEFGAHAWVEHDHRPLLAGADSDYETLTRL